MLPSILLTPPPTHAVDVSRVKKAKLGEGQLLGRATWAMHSFIQRDRVDGGRAEASTRRSGPRRKTQQGTLPLLPGPRVAADPAVSAREGQSPHLPGRAGCAGRQAGWRSDQAGEGV